MNNFPWPYMPNPMFSQLNIEEEIIKLREEIKILKEKIKKLENKENNDYLKKDEGMYMI